MWPSSLAHVVPLEPGEGGHAAFVLALLVVGATLAALVGILVGERVRARPSLAPYAGPFAAGALLLLLFDLLKEAAGLGQSLVRNPALQLALLLAFAVGALLLGFARTPRALAWLWVAGIALHSAGEGWIVGTEAEVTDLTGVLGIASYLLHKGIEGMTIPILVRQGRRQGEGDGGGGGEGRQAALYAIALGAATLVAAVGGLLVVTSNVPTLLFAAGAGAAAVAALRLGGTSAWGWRAAAAMVVGALAVWGAGLLHEL